MTPGLLGLVAGLVLSAVFVAAGVGKLTDWVGTRKAVGEFGAPDWLVGPLALLLPVAELALAVALLFATTRVVAAAAIRSRRRAEPSASRSPQSSPPRFLA